MKIHQCFQAVLFFWTVIEYVGVMLMVLADSVLKGGHLVVIGQLNDSTNLVF